MQPAFVWWSDAGVPEARRAGQRVWVGRRGAVMSLLALAALPSPCMGAAVGAAAATTPSDRWLLPQPGRRQLLVVDADRRAVVRRLPVDAPLVGAHQIDADGGTALLGTADGWIRRHDLRSGAVVAAAQVGAALQAWSVGGQGGWILVATADELVLLDGGLSRVKRLPVATLDGRAGMGVDAVRDLPARRSFVVLPRGIAELWEISYDPRAEPIYDGLVHDYQMGEGIAKPGQHNMRRTPLPEPMALVLTDPSGRHVLLAAPGAGQPLRVVNLDVRRQIAELPLAAPRNGAAAGAAVDWNGAPVLLIPDPRAPALVVVDPRGWRVPRRIALPGLGGHVRGHTGSPFIWIDVEPTPGGHGRLTLIDARTLEPVRTLETPGPVSGPVQFDREGRQVMVPQPDGAGWIYAAGGEGEPVRVEP